MTKEQLQENIEDGLIRLKREYMLCYEGYDRAALKSLAHTLRYWVDMRTDVDRYLTEHNPLAKFTTYSTTILFNRTFRGKEYIAACFPRRVVLRAQRHSAEDVANGMPSDVTVSNLAMPMPVVEEGESVALKYSFDYKALGLEECSIGQFILVVDKSVQNLAADRDIYIINNQAFDVKKVKFGSWLDGLGARVTFPLGSTSPFRLCDISREDMIKRVANVLGGSHPRGGRVILHDKDAAVNQLMKYRLLHIPVPYMVLMKVAHDILQVFNSL